MTQTTATFKIGTKVNLKSDTTMLVTIGGGNSEPVDLADGKWEWTVKAIKEHEGKLCYRMETRTLGRHVSLNSVMNGPGPRAHDYITHTRWLAVDPTERD
jgi:hypothetical protein